MGTGTIGQSRHKTWRLRTVLPAVLTTVAAVAAGGVIRSAPPASAPVSFADGTPIGTLDKLADRPGGLRAVGWAFDPNDKTAAARVNARVDGERVAGMAANLPRDDVATDYPKAGANHGFNFFVPVPEGEHTVCVRVRNVGDGSNLTLRCLTSTFDYGPQGALEKLATQPGHLVVSGWVVDWDAPTDPVTVNVVIDGTATKLSANTFRKDLAQSHPAAGGNHGFAATLPLKQGKHQVCVTAVNLGYGSNNSLGCKSITLNDNPKGALTSLTPTSTGLRLRGWAADPDTSDPISVEVRVDGQLARTQVAGGDGLGHDGHVFNATMLARSGTHKVCVTGLNTLYGANDSQPSCRSLTLALKPLGAFEALTRVTGSTNLRVKGWALDPDTRQPISVQVTLDGAAAGTVTADAARADVGAQYPAWGDNHGMWAKVSADDGEHTVCLTAVNVGGGANVQLGCKLIIAVHPVAPGAPRNVLAVAGYGGAEVTWSKPTSDGGAPWTKYVVVSDPGAIKVTVGPSETSATVLGLKPSTQYTFTVRAVNVAGTSVAGTSPAVKTQASPPAQTTPAPVSTSRYIRNIRGSSPSELAMMKSEGATDAYYNPSGHGYLQLLDIGGQDQYDDGVVLSAGVRFVTYRDLVADLKAYVAGYHSKQKASAPVTIALGTNNDMDVSKSSGRTWARRVVQPVVDYAKRYPGITIAGANDIEPGFRASYTQTKRWLSGYLANTHAPFVFNGSADGCSWTNINQGCNNGWRMAGLYHLTAGAAPVRMLNLPQIYNTTMAAQWKYISLTGISAGSPRINFGGPLTEWTACNQARSCGSLTGHSAWQTMWNNLQSDARLKVASLPYSTDLRIDS